MRFLFILLCSCYLFVGCSKQPSNEVIFELKERLQSTKPGERELAQSRLNKFRLEYPDSYWVNLLYLSTLSEELLTNDCIFDIDGCKTMTKNQKEQIIDSVERMTTAAKIRKGEDLWLLGVLYNLTAIGEHELAIKYYSKFF